MIFWNSNILPSANVALLPKGLPNIDETERMAAAGLWNLDVKTVGSTMGIRFSNIHADSLSMHRLVNDKTKENRL